MAFTFRILEIERWDGEREADLSSRSGSASMKMWIYFVNLDKLDISKYSPSF